MKENGKFIWPEKVSGGKLVVSWDRDDAYGLSVWFEWETKKRGELWRGIVYPCPEVTGKALKSALVDLYKACHKYLPRKFNGLRPEIKKALLEKASGKNNKRQYGNKS